MTRQQFEQYLYQQQSGPFGVYVRDLVNEFNGLNQTQQDFFLDRIANETLDPKMLTGFAKIVAIDKDPTAFMSMSYYDLKRLSEDQLHALPGINGYQQTFTQQSPYVASEKTPQERIQDIVDRYCMPKSNTTDEHRKRAEETFAQTNNSAANIARQGWKFHVSADSMEDYARLCETLVPELQKSGAVFKVVRPEAFERFMSGDQVGKAITIYSGPGFSLDRLSPEAQAILQEPINNQVHGDLALGGRMFARYGAFHSTHTMTRPDGQQMGELRHIATHPDFVQSDYESVLNFYSNSEQRFNETGDYRAYMQERHTMAQCDGQHYAYMSFKINPNQMKDIQAILNANDPNKNKLSFLTAHEVNGNMEYLLVLHKSDITTNYVYHDQNGQAQHAFTSPHSRLLQDLQSMNISLERPEWDRREGAVIIPNQSKELIEGLCARSGNLEAYVGITENGTVFVQGDMMIMDELKETLENEFHIPFADYNRNLELDARDAVNQIFEMGQFGEISLEDIEQAITIDHEDVNFVEIE